MTTGAAVSGTVLQAALMVLYVLAFRAFPVVVALSMSSRVSRRDRWTALALYGGVVVLASAGRRADLGEIPKAYAYLLVVSLLSFAVRTFLPARTWAHAFLAFFTCLLIPAKVWGSHAVVLTIGWETALCIYSYCVDARATVTLEEYLVFLFVNPVVVFSQRGRQRDFVGLDYRGAVRVLRGFLCLMASLTLLSFWNDLPGTKVGGSQPLLATGVGRLASFYLAHTGLADVQIGLAYQAGCQPPERYLRPLMARSPRDFWMRWNTYIGMWARSYIFRPLSMQALRVVRLNRRIARALAATGVVVLTFALVGVMHDLFAMLDNWAVSTNWTIWFTVNAIVCLAWEVLAARLPRREHSRWLVGAQRAAFLLAAVALAASGPVG